MNMTPASARRCGRLLVLAAAFAFALPVPATAQTFDSTSTGSDGALDLTGQSGTVVFDPQSFEPPLDPDGDNVFQFTSITIPAGLTLRLTAEKLNFAPVYWLASGDVLIQGTVNLSGSDGHPIDVTERRPSMPGPGGFPGGVGPAPDSPPTYGFGPGGGTFGTRQGIDAFAAGGYATSGSRTQSWALSPTYGNRFIIPLIGGSGGSGQPRATADRGGGGAGGGALLVASSQSVTVNGQILALGGGSHGSGPGSGGAIRILSPVFAGSGRLSVEGGRTIGPFFGGLGGSGRIRIESGDHQFSGQIVGENRRASLSPQARFLPESSWPSVRVTSVAGVAMSPTPTGSFAVPDVAVDTAEAVTIEIEAKHIPVGTGVSLYLFSEDGVDQVIETTALAGTEATSTATAQATFPPGFSRVFVRATW